ncbi:MAG TPA: arsenate reductase ArsC [Bacteroidia bacterium]|jgi:arsenate reductase|nr:arsenate reductase ArsC [Bacteroidia bacterium]
MNKKKVLFMCIHNSGRSQMAEAFLNNLGGDKFEAESAGLEPGNLNPLVVEAMHELGIDISKNQTNDVFEFYKQGKLFEYVITVCDEASGEKCPIFPGIVSRIHWSFPDPGNFEGTHDEKMAQVRTVRDSIKKKIEEFIVEKIA